MTLRAAVLAAAISLTAAPAAAQQTPYSLRADADRAGIRLGTAL